MSGHRLQSVLSCRVVPRSDFVGSPARFPSLVRKTPGIPVLTTIQSKNDHPLLRLPLFHVTRM